MRFFVVLLALVLVSSPAGAQDFKAWLKEMRRAAAAEGISAGTISAALPDTLKPIDRVIALDRKQPEGTKTFAQYFGGVVTSQRVGDGRAKYQDHKSTLYEVGANYGVDPQYIVALWGIETNFGRNTGGYDVIAALATLAWDGRRSAFFRAELLKALHIVDQGHIPLDEFKGSWAGAMGQTQFMPSSFLRFAEDYNKDGRRDIWRSKPDIFASAANYLSQSGWKHGQPWGRRISLPKNFDSKLVGLDTKRSLQAWHDAGVRLPDGASVPFEGTWEASIVQPDGPGTQAYMVYDNYRVIMKWNKSTYFATSVGLLADRIKG